MEILSVIGVVILCAIGCYVGNVFMDISNIYYDSPLIERIIMHIVASIIGVVIIALIIGVIVLIVLGTIELHKILFT